MDMINNNFQKINNQKKHIINKLRVVSDILNKKLFKIVNSQNILSNALADFQEDLQKHSENKRFCEVNIQASNQLINEL